MRLRRKTPASVDRLVAGLTVAERFALKQALAGSSRFYGDGGTIHSTGYLDVEIYDGRVVSVWFRCQMLPFKAHQVGSQRAAHMDNSGDLPQLRGVTLRDAT